MRKTIFFLLGVVLCALLELKESNAQSVSGWVKIEISMPVPCLNNGEGEVITGSYYFMR